jgi:hypothetical protein
MKAPIKKALKSNTMKYALIIDILATIQLNADELRAAIPPEFYGYFLIAVGIGIKYFRYITKDSLDDK